MHSPRRGAVLWIALLALPALGCAKMRTERSCRQAADEYASSAKRPGWREEFLLACGRLSPEAAQCTIPSYSQSWVVKSERACAEYLAQPDFPRAIILGR